ncbi:fungal-specific transcription factor domain-containing protein [Bipolaris maydis]|nr:fungal-specific transcription factor domain-containing protein [Bipolaris maydis]
MEENMGPSADDVVGKRSCEYCRTKKIRCDRTVPCSNCRMNKAVREGSLTSQDCKTVVPEQKPPKVRISLSGEYEKKIDRLESRLANIETVLAKIASKLEIKDAYTVFDEHVIRTESSSTQLNEKSSVIEAESTTPTPFEGETGMNRQSDYVRELLVQVVGQTPSMDQNIEVKAALTALEELVTPSNHGDISPKLDTQQLADRSIPRTDSAKLEQPPWSVVKVAMDKVLEHPTMIFTAFFPIIDAKNLYEVIEDFYSNPTTCGTPRRIFASGVLFNIFSEFSSAPWSGTTKADLTRVQLELAISQLGILIPASHENIVALSLGTACAVEMCKPSLAWMLNSCAVELCQNLGYHRFATMKNDPEEEQRRKMHLFWMIYYFDKQLSLRLGRASIIQDWDVSLPFLATSDASHNGSEGNKMLPYWVKVAKVQGKTYESLFSAAAFLNTQTERYQTAVSLVRAMEQAWHERGYVGIRDSTNLASPIETELPFKHKQTLRKHDQDALKPGAYDIGYLNDVEGLFFYTDVVVHYSTCALIYRAACPVNTLSQECLESSRAAILAHMRCNAQFNSKANTELWAGYIHWSILEVCKIFIVLFCNAIQRTDRTDLDSLSDFVTSLESCRTFSEGAEKLYKMCLLFLKVARIYIQAKETEIEKGLLVSLPDLGQDILDATAPDVLLDFSTVSQFGPHLSALGLLSNTDWSMAGYMPDSVPEGHEHYPSTEAMSGAQDFEGVGMSQQVLGVSQNSVQDWFSGSRYLINFMDLDNDMQMPDMNNPGF